MRRAPRLYGLPFAIGPLVGLALLFVACPGVAYAQAGDEWTNINGDASGARYSTLTQITPQNFTNLQVAWEWVGEEDAGLDLGGGVNARSLPIYVDGRLITTSGPKRTVVALDPATGRTLWTY